MNQSQNIIIIGAGLSGLYCAWKLQQKQMKVTLLDARERTGGRILSHDYTPQAKMDLGPAWVWPQLQPRIQGLMSQLGIDTFSQYISGDMLYEKTESELERFSGQSSHMQSYRIDGSGRSLIDALQSCIPAESVHLNTPVQSIHKDDLRVVALKQGKTCTYSADKIILAIPPRLALQQIHFEPELPEDTRQTWHNTHTWMSSHCKILFIYTRPFWREQKLSGEVFSHVGPLSEIYDGSPESEDVYALTSFVGINAAQRKQLGKDRLIKLCMAQLQRLFGDESQQVIEIKIKDWSQDGYTSTELDLTMPVQHPQYDNDMPRSFWDEQLILAGTEVARQHGGYLEGALESADEAISICCS